MKILNLLTNEINQNNYHFNKLTKNKIGILYISPVNMVPDDCLACDGYVLKISDYKKLHSAIGSRFNTGAENSDEFRIPDYNITKRFLQPGNDVAKVIAAGLPNITGALYQDGINDTSNNGVIWGAGGALYVSSNSTNVATYNGSGKSRNVKHIEFNAARCSSIYNNSSTVQPPSQVVHICIKYK